MTVFCSASPPVFLTEGPPGGLLVRMFQITRPNCWTTEQSFNLMFQVRFLPTSSTALFGSFLWTPARRKKTERFIWLSRFGAPKKRVKLPWFGENIKSSFIRLMGFKENVMIFMMMMMVLFSRPWNKETVSKSCWMKRNWMFSQKQKFHSGWDKDSSQGPKRIIRTMKW